MELIQISDRLFVNTDHITDITVLKDCIQVTTTEQGQVRVYSPHIAAILDWIECKKVRGFRE